VDEDCRNDLRMFVLDQVRDDRRLHPLQAFDAADVAANENAVYDAASLAFAKRLGQH